MDGVVVIGTELDTKNFESQIAKTEKELNRMVREYNNLQKISSKGIHVNAQQMTDLAAKIEMTNNKLTTLRKKQLDINKFDLSSIGKSIDNVTKKVGRWALAVFGVRSAYMFIRQSISTLSQYNEKLAADIQNIRYALASALEPLITRIIDLVYKLLGYLGYIIKAWTGRNIFENANKGLKKAVGTAKELQKTLSGFDEMNIIGQNTKASGGGGTPSVDLSKLPKDVPWWVDALANPKILTTLFGILTFFRLVNPLITKFGTKLGLIKALGIGILVKGILDLIQDVIKYLKDSSWENFTNILIDIGVILLGLALIFTSWPLALAAAIVLMLGIIAKFWDKIKEFLVNLRNNITQFGENITDWLHEHLGILGDIIGGAIQGFLGVITGAIDMVISLFDGLFDGLKKILDGIVMIFKGDFKNGIVTVLKGIANIIIGVLNFLIDGLNTILAPIRALIMVIGKVMGKDWTMDNIRIPKIPKLERGGIVHNPGPGVLMGNYIAGEGSSPEAVLPLDDNTMDRLGESIAKHMTINANITNTMNGRVISRELHKINNESAFAYNG